MLNKVCKDVMIEPPLMPLNNEKFKYKTTNRSAEARLDIKANSFWRKGQTAFFDIRVTHVNCKTNEELNTSEVFLSHEKEKKRQYLKRVLDVEHGTFTPLVFGTNGGLGKECGDFIKNLGLKIAEQEDEKFSIIMSWLRTKLSFEIVKSVLLCVRGSRTPFRKQNVDSYVMDFKLNALEVQVPIDW